MMSLNSLTYRKHIKNSENSKTSLPRLGRLHL